MLLVTSMNNALKIAALLLILPLLIVALTTNNFHSADALKAKGSPGDPSTKGYGQKTAHKVCGDHLCSDKSVRSITSEK